MKELIFITGNPGKAKYLSEYFHLPVRNEKIDLPEIQSLDLEEVVRDKAWRAFEKIKEPVLVEDTSLEFESLGSLPGPYIKWFYERLGNEGLCHLLNGYENRNAIARAQFGFCDGKEVYIFEGSTYGKIADKPRGSGDFGWGPIFIPDGYSKTWGEMTSEEKHHAAMRKAAVEKLGEFLKEKFI